MGCDIHMHVEKMVDGKWNSITEGIDVYEDPSYGVFAVLGNPYKGKYKVAPVVASRGFPPDVSAEVDECYKIWEPEAFSASWVFLEELISYPWFDLDFYISGFYGFVHEIAMKNRGEYDKVRIVFWFDN